MSHIEFFQNNIFTIINCNHNEKLKDILVRYANKTGNDINSASFIYWGNVINNLELTFDQIANKFDSRRNKLIIQIKKADINTENNSIIKSKIIICPKCLESTRIKINNYKIRLYGCKNNHKINNILFKEFEETQKIDISQIICDICKLINKNTTHDNVFYF